MNLRLVIIMGILLVFGSCRETTPKYIYNEGLIYGTIYHIVYESPDGKDMQQEISKELEKYNLIFSTFAKESVISKINSNEETEIPEEFSSCFLKAEEISRSTGGAFDITCGPMVNAWGFGPEDKIKMTPEIIDSLKEITGFQKVRLTDGKIIKDNPQMKLDMSAIAKGYTCDLVAGFLHTKKCRNYMVEIGGEVVAKGKNEKGNTWMIGISKPDENAFFSSSDLQEKMYLPDMAMATSGNYRNFYVEDGKKYAHTIDPKTGYPVEHSLLSATVVCSDCMTADAYATAFMVMGLEKGVETSAQHGEMEVYFIYADEQGNNQVYMSEGFRQFLAK